MCARPRRCSHALKWDSPGSRTKRHCEERPSRALSPSCALLGPVSEAHDLLHPAHRHAVASRSHAFEGNDLLLNAGANKIKSTIWGSRARHAARAHKVRHRVHFAAATMSLNLCASASSRVTLPLLTAVATWGGISPATAPSRSPCPSRASSLQFQDDLPGPPRADLNHKPNM